jgi:hypothetical protein
MMKLLLRCMSPFAVEADIRAVGGSSGFDPNRKLLHARDLPTARVDEDRF